MRVSLCFVRVASAGLRRPVTYPDANRSRAQAAAVQSGVLHRGRKVRRTGEVDEAAKRACPAPLRDREEVMAIALAKCGTGGLRQRWNHRGDKRASATLRWSTPCSGVIQKFERDVKTVEAFVVEGRWRALGRVRREGSGGPTLFLLVGGHRRRSVLAVRFTNERQRLYGGAVRAAE